MQTTQERLPGESYNAWYYRVKRKPVRDSQKTRTKSERARKQGNPIAEARIQAGLTQKEFAEAIGNPGVWRQVQEWEYGRVIPSLSIANAIARRFGFESGGQLRWLCMRWQQMNFEKSSKTAQNLS